MAIDDSGRPNADPEHGSPGSRVLPQGLPMNLDTFGAKAEEWMSGYTKQLQVLDALRAWNRWNTDCRQSLWRSILGRLGVCRRPACPPHPELFSLARSFFPLRSDLRVTVFDMGNDRTERTDVPFAKVRQYLSSKPDWVTIRWMHIPLGNGLLQSSVEDMFFWESIPRRTASNFGHAENKSDWPYLQFDIINLRGILEMQELLDAFCLLRNFPELAQALESANFYRQEDDTLRGTVNRRAWMYGFNKDFWTLTQSDLSWQLGEGIRADPRDAEGERDDFDWKIEEQVLSQHPGFRHAILARDSFRALYRDGFALTFSAMKGVNCTERSVLHRLDSPPQLQQKDPDASVLEFVRNSLYEGLGSQNWGQNPLEHFLIYLITEIAKTPHNENLGRNRSSIPEAYQLIIRNLKRRGRQVRRHQTHFRRYESVELVRQYVTCMDEISQLIDSANQTLDFLEMLRQDCIGLEYSQMGRNVNSSLSRVESAIDTIRYSNQMMQRNLDELSSSLNVLFQLRTIEQNELAILAESNNKAILVFTMVTIIFLPLSFFTSYFGMNLKGFASTTRTEGYFWSVGGTATVCIVVITIIFGFRRRFWWWLWGRHWQDRRGMS
ncbi:MAG: hypothetical protein Q9214_005882 [Letrouitia sp. 1 TL-2023]